jgi:hypothetical protein
MLARSLHRAVPGAANKSAARAVTSKKENNAAIIELLQQRTHSCTIERVLSSPFGIDLREESEKHDRNAYKVRAFASAIKVINKLDHPIRSTTEAKAVSPSGT